MTRQRARRFMARLTLAALGMLSAPGARAAGAAKVSFRTEDGWRLAALYHPPRPGRAVAVLVHGVASDKHEWDELAPELWKLGLGTLALDLRGHGESRAGPGGETGYQGFDASGEWPRAVRDLEAALAFLRRRGARKAALVGASIGANLASEVAASTPVAWVALLSPGFDYRGVALARELDRQPTLIGASSADPYAWSTYAELARSPLAARYAEASGGHGVQMLRDPAFRAKLLDWIKERTAQ